MVEGVQQGPVLVGTFFSTSLAGGVARPHAACCVILSSGFHVARCTSS